MKKFLSVVLALVMALSIISIANADDSVTLRMATGYNNANAGISFDAGTAGEGIELADGVTYNTGDLKPTWVELEKILDVKFVDVYTGLKESENYDFWEPKLAEVDMISATSEKLTAGGIDGKFVNIAEYLDQMPNFKAYLDANPIVKLSITGNVKTGAIYFSPYFDGVDDIEKMVLMRTDWVEKLLNGEGEFTAEACNKLAAPVYEPYMPTEGKIDIDTPNLEGTAVETVTKDYDAYGNIVAKMNEAGELDGVAAVNMLREYIDKTYGGYYGTERANLFIGQNAAWDADELVALLRCVVANPQTLNGTDSVQGIFSREEGTLSRRCDMYRLAANLFGVRGLESRKDFLYVDTDGTMKDARMEVATYEALGRMNMLAQEGLISKDFIEENGDMKTQQYLENDYAFMHYDYNQTQTVYNEMVNKDTGLPVLDSENGEKYMAVMVPVARWYDGTDENGVYMRFTESWRSVKPTGWGISKAGVEANPAALEKALALIDYAYSEQGIILMSYGPDAFIKKDADGNYVTFNFNGKEMPEIADATRAELWDKQGGNYTNYARRLLGSTLSFMKSQAFEYQCTTEAGREGAGHISTAIALGTIKHPLLAVNTENMWYTSVPTVLPFTTTQNTEIKGFTDLSDRFDTSKGVNVLVNIIAKGFDEEGMYDAEEAAESVTDAWSGTQYLAIVEEAWEAAQQSFAGQN